MIDVTLQVAKQGFFDRDRVKRSVDAATRKILSRFGAYVMTRAKTSIRKKDGASPPGTPPHSHVGLLRRFILFAYEPQRKSVVIGPILIREGSRVPSLLEFGGTVTRRKGDKIRLLRYRPRPYMGPAFRAELAQLPEQWRNSIK